MLRRADVRGMDIRRGDDPVGDDVPSNGQAASSTCAWNSSRNFAT